MQTFSYARATTLPDAIAAVAQADAMVIVGGTELLNWMKEGIVALQWIIDLNALAGLDEIVVDDKGLKIGALARMSDVAENEAVKREYPAISQALFKSASPQIRNMASMGGNVMQRTRCPYFRAEVALPCNKRRPGSGCSAIEGEDRHAAVFGASEHCIATHPSDLAVALAALDAVSMSKDRVGRAQSRLHGFTVCRAMHRTAKPNSIEARSSHRSRYRPPPSPDARTMLKIRERASYEFALVSAAVGIDMQGPNIRQARIALGGVAPKPWRLNAAEQALRGVSLSDGAALRQALDIDFSQAKPGRHNGFKVELAKRTAIRALQTAGGLV